MSRRPTLRLEQAAVVVAAAALLPGCLPDDTRPEPGSLLVNAAPSVAAGSGLSTPDGWMISFERLLAAIGAIQLEGDECNGYGEPRYTRLFDFASPMEAPQKVALVYGLGACDLGYELSPPERDAVLGPGVTAADLEQMRTELDDDWISEPERMSVYVRGAAARGDVTKRFEWVFRMEYDVEKCEPGPDGEGGTRVDIAGGEAFERTIVFDPTELFRESTDADAPLRFDALAESDADGDGAITQKELDAVPAPPAAGAEEGDDSSLADLLYDELVPRMARPPGSGECEVDLDRR
jgi:hypothetical protein